ncbi:MAG: ABC transporter permease subunit [Streptosporangiales bacterium]|nr:ABC transporter permease subunit [Streptosporangiales bacterium]
MLAPVLPVLLVVVWYLASRDSTPSSAYPYPAAIVRSGLRLLTDGELLQALATSLIRVLLGFGIALGLGLGLSLLMGRLRVVREMFDPLIESVRPIAPIALVPLAILWLGTGNASAVSIIAYAAFFPIVLNVTAAVRDLDPSLVDVARTFGVSELTILRQVVLPGVLPGVVVGARLGMGLGWASVIAAELAVGSDVSASVGIGQLMLTFYQYDADPNPIVVCMIAVGLLGFALDMLMRQTGRALAPWHR